MKLQRRRVLKLFAASVGVPSALGAASVPAPASGQGLIVVYRPKRAVGAVLLFSTTVDGTLIGNLTNGRVLVKDVAPGPHRVETASASVAGLASVAVDVAAGQTVYVKAEARMGYPAGRPSLALVSEAQGASDVARL